MNKFAAALRANRITIIVWLVIILGIAGLISFNRATEHREYAALSSPVPAVRDAMVLSLVQGGNLIDVLTNTEDPNTEATSPQNVKSASIRENAAASVNRLSASGRISASSAIDTMFQLSKDSDGTVKTTSQAGLQALGEKNPANLRALVTRLSDGDPDIRSTAVTVLGMIGGVAGFGDKTASLVNATINDPTAQSSAESALQGIGAPAVPYLTSDMNAPGATLDFQLQIVALLGQIGTVNTLAPLTTVARSIQPAMRHDAYVALANIVLSSYTALQTATKATKPLPAAIQTASAAYTQATQSEPFLISALKNTSSDSQTRSQAALALGDIGNTSAVQALVVAMGDYDTQVQQAAISGLQTAGAAAVTPLIAALDSPNVQAASAAAEALGGIGNTAAIAALNSAFHDSTTPANVRRTAAVGLGRSGNPSVIPTLVSALADPDGQVESAASAALLSPQLSVPAIPLLIASFSKPTPVPFNASETLSRMGNQAVPALETATKDNNPDEETWAAITLGETDSKDPGIVTALTPLTASANSEVKFAASQALNSLSGS